MTLRSLRFIAIAGALFVSSPAFSADAAPTDDGLVPIKVKNIDKAYKLPGASLSGYNKLLFKPVSVAFSKSWDPRDYGGTFGLSTKDVEKIRTGLATLADETFRKVLTEGGYTFVTEPGEGVLELDAQIVDLYVNAPDTMEAGRSRTYVMSAGEMKLAMALRDAVTGKTLFRANDRKRGQETGRLEWANSVWNRAEAQRALAGWAKQLKEALDAAREKQ